MPVAADRGERTREGAGIAGRRDLKAVIEFLPGIVHPGERGVAGDPGEDEGDDLLPVSGKSVFQDGEEIAELFFQQGSVAVFVDGTGL